MNAKHSASALGRDQYLDESRSPSSEQAAPLLRPGWVDLGCSWFPGSQAHPIPLPILHPTSSLRVFREALQVPNAPPTCGLISETEEVTAG